MTARLKYFSDVHGSRQQRFFKLICLAYGADPGLATALAAGLEYAEKVLRTLSFDRMQVPPD